MRSISTCLDTRVITFRPRANESSRHSPLKFSSRAPHPWDPIPYNQLRVTEPCVVVSESNAALQGRGTSEGRGSAAGANNRYSQLLSWETASLSSPYRFLFQDWRSRQATPPRRHLNWSASAPQGQKPNNGTAPSFILFPAEAAEGLSRGVPTGGRGIRGRGDTKEEVRTSERACLGLGDAKEGRPPRRQTSDPEAEPGSRRDAPGQRKLPPAKPRPAARNTAGVSFLLTLPVPAPHLSAPPSRGAGNSHRRCSHFPSSPSRRKLLASRTPNPRLSCSFFPAFCSPRWAGGCRCRHRRAFTSGPERGEADGGKGRGGAAGEDELSLLQQQQQQSAPWRGLWELLRVYF